MQINRLSILYVLFEFSHMHQYEVINAIFEFSQNVCFFCFVFLFFYKKHDYIYGTVVSRYYV